MSAIIMDGKALALQIEQKIAEKVQLRLDQGLRAPGLAVIMLDENPASKIYVEKKQSTSEKLGFISKVYTLPPNTSEIEILKIIDDLNGNKAIDGILIQLPLPEHLNPDKILQQIRPDKDVDGFHPCNIGKLALGLPAIRSCTPKGIMTLLKSYAIPKLEGMNAVIIGASNIVGKPMALELLLENCTVTICHIFTKDIIHYLKCADLVVAAAGSPNLICGEWLKKGAVVIDVGINRLDNGKIVGDVDFFTAKEKASYITPVPGGVGPMTVAMLMKNTLFAADKLHN